MISLRLKLTAAMALLLGVMAAVSLVMLRRLMTDSGNDAALSRGVAVSRVLANALRPTLDFDDAADARRLLDLTSGKHLAYASVRKASGALLAEHLSETRADPAAAEPVPSVDLVVAADQDHAYRFVGDRLFILTRVEVPATEGSPRRVLGTLRMDFSTEETRRQQTERFLLAFWVALLVVVVGCGIGYLLGGYLVKPVLELAEVTRVIAERGDLRAAITVHTNDETGILADRFRQMVEGQRALLAALRSSASGVLEVLEAVERSSSTVGHGAATIESELVTTTHAMRGMLGTLQGVGGNVTDLRDSARKGGEAIRALAATSDQVARSVGEMSRNVAGSADAVDQMAGSVTRVAGSIEELDRALASTSAAMDQIRHSIDDVQKNAQQSAALSTRAAKDAEGGARALTDAFSSMDRIRDTAAQSFQVLAQLGQSVSAIHGIVEFINDLAHKTNLLALNAGIIAAHAGEHGSAFNVVAQEIKQLADRTRASTAEITSVISRIREESDKASAAMHAGMVSVDEGERVGKDAGSALQLIRASSQQGREMVEAIALATEQEAGHTRTVVDAYGRIGRNLQQITVAAQEQARESQRLRSSTRDIHLLTDQVKKASEIQAGSCREVLDAIEGINTLVARVDVAQGQQTQAAESALRAVEAIREVSGQQSESAGRLQSVVDALRRQAEDLQSVMRRFQA